MPGPVGIRITLQKYSLKMKINGICSQKDTLNRVDNYLLRGFRYINKVNTFDLNAMVLENEDRTPIITVSIEILLKLLI